MDLSTETSTRQTRRSTRRVALALLVALGVLASTPLGASAIETTSVGGTRGVTVRTPTEPIRTDVLIYRRSAMVTQYTNYWCVPAATQSMVNLVRGTSDQSRATQERYYHATRAHNKYSYATRGNDPQGWAWALTNYSGKGYAALSFSSRDAAFEAIRDSIARTRHPVGVTVARGTHAWTILGYRSEIHPDDPGVDRILGFYVSGPLGSPSDPWPYQYWSLTRFSEVFTRYHEWQRSVIWEGRYVVIAQ